MSGGSGGSSGTQQVQSTVTQTNLPEYVQPYFEQVLQRGLYESARPYQPYQGQRLAQFSPQEAIAQQGIMGLQTPQQVGMATNIAQRVADINLPSGVGIASQFQPGAITPTYGGMQFQTGYTPGGFNIGYQPQNFGDRYQAGTISSDYQAGAFTPGYQAGTFGGGYQAGQIGPGFEAGSVFAPGNMQTYMSPYQQAVTDVAKREAVRESEMQRPTIGAEAARTGALGGTRAALLEAERQKNLGQRLSDIQVQGSQAAFEQAKQAFEADRAARQAQTELGLRGFQTQEAARQAQMELGLRGFQTQEGARQQQAQFQLQAQQAGEAARQEAARLGLSAQQQNEAARQAQAEFGLRAFQANQGERQFAANLDMQALQAAESARQEAARLGLSAQQQSDAAARAAEQFRMQAQQFNVEQQRQMALLGLEGLAADRQGIATQLNAADILSRLGSQQQMMDLQRLAAQQAVGQDVRGLYQQGLNMGYEDFLRQQAYGREQLGYLSNLLQGVPIQAGSTVSTFGRVPTAEQQMLGAGLGALGLYGALRQPTG